MFDLSDDTLTRVESSTPISRLESDTGEDPVTPDNPLDSSENQDKHKRLLDFYLMELSRQSENRYQMAIDEDYFDSIQLTEEQMQELKDRGQPPTVYNVIQQSLNWLTGAERRGRTDFNILPRSKEELQQAQAKTKYLKYLSDVNKTPFHRSRAFEDAVKVGIGWLEEGVQDEDDGEPIYCRYESWRNMIWDSAGTELDGSDGRYQFRSKWVDEDVAIAMFPDRKEQINSAAVDSLLYGSYEGIDGDMAMDQAEWDRSNNGMLRVVVSRTRRRVRLIEAWYRLPEKVDRIRGSAFNGHIYDENDPRHVDAVNGGMADVVSRVMMRMRVAIMTTKDFLWEGPSPYRHNRFKFIPIWGYKRGRDGLPYGVIRGLRDIQDDVNKRMSKALHILNSNKVIMDEGALPDGVSMDDFAEEVARPDAIIVKRVGKQLELNVDRGLESSHIEITSRNISMIQQVSGVTDELMGRTTNATSGVAVEKRQQQGNLATSRFFDNLRLAEQMRGEIELSLVEQFATQQKQFRITNQRGTPEFVQINDGLPENDITRTKADFVISEADWRATMRQAAADQLTELLTKMPPQIALVMLDLLVENMDIPNRDEIVKRIRAVTNQQDPDQPEPTPEQQAAAQAHAQAQALQDAAAQAKVRLTNAQAAQAEATAKRNEALMLGDKMGAAVAAMQAAGAVVHMPTIAQVADNLLADAGWVIANPAQGLPQPQVPPQMQQTAPNGTAPMPEQNQPAGGA